MGKILQEYYSILLFFLIALVVFPNEVKSQSACNDKTLIGWYSSGGCGGLSACEAESYISASNLNNVGFSTMVAFH